MILAVFIYLFIWCICFSFFADFHRCNKALSAKGQDITPCEWYQRVYKSLCPISWVRVYYDLYQKNNIISSSKISPYSPCKFFPSYCLVLSLAVTFIEWLVCFEFIWSSERSTQISAGALILKPACLPLTIMPHTPWFVSQSDGDVNITCSCWSVFEWFCMWCVAAPHAKSLLAD